MPRPREYPEELLDRGVRLVFESERPISQVARHLGIHPEALRKRVRQTEADTGKRTDLLTSQEREEILKLRREIATLPDAHRAIIDPEKLRDYVLSPDHDHGKHKSRVFLSALGIDWDSWEYLREQIAARVVAAEVSEIRTGRYGVRYSVPMLIEGLNGQTHEVTTGWIIDQEGAPPRLTTAYVNVP